MKTIALAFWIVLTSSSSYAGTPILREAVVGNPALNSSLLRVVGARSNTLVSCSIPPNARRGAECKLAPSQWSQGFGSGKITFNSLSARDAKVLFELMDPRRNTGMNGLSESFLAFRPGQLIFHRELRAEEALGRGPGSPRRVFSLTCSSIQNTQGAECQFLDGILELP